MAQYHVIGYSLISIGMIKEFCASEKAYAYSQGLLVINFNFNLVTLVRWETSLYSTLPFEILSLRPKRFCKSIEKEEFQWSFWLHNISSLRNKTL